MSVIGLLSACVVACSTGPTQGLEKMGSDSGPIDAEGPTDGGLSMDAGGPTDRGLPADAEMLPLDAGPSDLGTAPDAGCGNLGRACPLSLGCGPGLSCNMDGPPGGICLPSGRATCGGFVNAQCPASAPRCMLFNGADFGPCLTDFEESCVCTSSTSSSRFACGV
jgi:hypothetical protein